MDNNKTKTTPVSLTEHLSALFDNEAGSFEQRRVLDELGSNEDLRQKLSSYALIGEVMRTTEVTATADSGFLAGIHSQIESEEDVYHQVQLKKTVTKASAANDDRALWLKPVGGFALAASVAAVAFFGFQNFQQNNGNAIDSSMMTATKSTADLTEKQMASAVVAPTTAPVTQMDTVAVNDYQQADSRTRMLLKRYVDSHMQYASNSAFFPSVRIIAYAN